MHDDYASYFKYEQAQHASCNAHHLRNLIFLQERYPQPWVQGMIDLLLEIKQAVATAKQAGQTALTAEQIADFEKRYCELLSEGEKANPPAQAENPAKKAWQNQTKSSPESTASLIPSPTGCAGVYV